MLLWFLCPIGDDTDRSSPAERRAGLRAALWAWSCLLVGIAAAGTLANLLPFLVVLVGAGVVWRSSTHPSPAAVPGARGRGFAGGAAAVVGGLAVVVLVGDPMGRLSTTLLAVG